MLSDKMQKALNDQVNAELYSAYLYLSMSAYFESIALKGFAHWMICQTQEEVVHAMKLFDHVCERGGRAALAAIDGPAVEWDSPLAAFQDAYSHEVKVTGLINGLVDLAIAESDHASNAFLQWFVTEQVEEEGSADEVVQKLKLVGDSNTLFLLDQDMAQRIFTPPPPAGE